VNPGKQEGGGGTKKMKTRRVCFSRYLAVNYGLGLGLGLTLGDLLRVVCDEGGRARSRATIPSTIVRAVPLGSVS